MFIFILQGIWLYISELAGKDLDIGIILKFLWFYSPRIVTLVLPLSILVTSLMVFGGFAERYEFAAMKSTGISLQRAMRSLSVFIILLGITAFFFSNNVIPYSEYKWQNLRRNIQQFKPSMVIAEGQFNQIGEEINIKVDEKSGENGEFLKGVIIHRKNMKRPSSNLMVTIAEKGELTSEEGSNTLSLILRNGYDYQELVEKDYKKQQREPFVKTYFEEYTLNIDLTALNNQDVDQENNISNQNMYNIGELSSSIDSLSDAYSKDVERFAENMYYRTGSVKFNDEKTKSIPVNDTVTSVLDVFPGHQRADIIAMAVNNANGTIQAAIGKKTDSKRKVRRLNKYEIALHEKIVLGIACIILFFIGAPLGAIIRKGGMGFPMVVAVVLFLTYHFLGIFAKNSAEDGSIHPFIGTWLSTFIMLPLSIWLTYRATTDQGIVDFDQFGQRIARLFGKKEKDAAILIGDHAALLTQQEKTIVLSKNITELIEIVKNPEAHHFNEEMQRAAATRLKDNGFDQSKLDGLEEDKNYNYKEAESSYLSFLKNSRVSLLFYVLSFLIFIALKLSHFATNFMEISPTIIVISRLIVLLLFYIFMVKAILNFNRFEKQIGKKSDTWIGVLILFLGPIIYVLFHFYYKNKMKEQLQMLE